MFRVTITTDVGLKNDKGVVVDLHFSSLEVAASVAALLEHGMLAADGGPQPECPASDVRTGVKEHVPLPGIKDICFGRDLTSEDTDAVDAKGYVGAVMRTTAEQFSRDKLQRVAEASAILQEIDVDFDDADDCAAAEDNALTDCLEWLERGLSLFSRTDWYLQLEDLAKVNQWRANAEQWLSQYYAEAVAHIGADTPDTVHSDNTLSDFKLGGSLEDDKE